jgi:hypothetical protein
MTLRDKCAHFDIGQRAVLFALACDVPLNVSLLASHVFLVSLRGSRRHQARSTLAELCLFAWRQCGSAHPASSIGRTSARRDVHGGLLAALLRVGPLAIRRRNPRKI